MHIPSLSYLVLQFSYTLITWLYVSDYPQLL